MIGPEEWRRINSGGRAYMRERDVGTERDPPRAWVIQVDEMTVAKAREVGRLLADNDVAPVRFLSGGLADNMREYARWCAAQSRRGGDEDGQEE